MKRFSLVLVLLIGLSGCTCVSPEVAGNIKVLRDNTHALSKSYRELLDRSVAPPGPEGETPEQVEQREAAWQGHMDHERALMVPNDILADKVLEWAEIEAGLRPEDQ